MPSLQKLNATELKVVEKTKTGLVKQDDGKALYDLFHPGTVSGAYLASEWTANEEIRILTGIARGEAEEGQEPPDYRTRMRAVKELKQRAFDALALSGGVAKISASRTRTDADGNEIHENVEGVRVGEGGAHFPTLSKTAALLDGGLLKEDIPGQDQEEGQNDGEDDRT